MPVTRTNKLEDFSSSLFLVIFKKISIYTIIYLPWLFPKHFMQLEGGVVMYTDVLLSFLVSVLAGIVSYYICKWLDR